MKKLLTFAAAAFASVGMSFSAHAVVIDFGAFANGNEFGINSGDQQPVNGVDLQYFSNFNPYFDSFDDGKPAGLGVCRVLTVSAQCDEPGDDSIDGEMGTDEFVQVFFTSGVANDFVTTNIVGLSFRDGEHNPINDSMGLVAWTFFGAGGGVISSGTSSFADLVIMASMGIQNAIGLELAYVNTDFYLEAMEISDVPIPAALPLLLSGLAGLGFAARRRKAA